MRKIIALTIILLMILNVFSVIASTGGENKEIDYNNRNDVNKLDAKDLASAIEQGKIKDMSIVNDNKLADALKDNPSIAVKLEDKDFARAINQDASLIDNNKIFENIESRAKKNTFILNDNPTIKKKWFSKHGITDEGAELESYDGTIVKTKGSEATTFNINDHPGAKVLPSGRLVLSNGVEIAYAAVTKGEDESINVDGGYTDLSNSENSNVYITNGAVQIGDKVYASSTKEQIHITAKDGENVIVGEKVVEMDKTNGETTAVFTGKITNYADGHTQLGSNTDFTEYSNDKKNLQYSVTKDTDYYLGEGCSNSINSCIEMDKENSYIKVIAKSNNEIIINNFNQQINAMTVPIITDSSTLKYVEKSMEEALFSKEPIKIKGDQANLPIIATGFVNDNGEACYNYIGSAAQKCEKDLGKLIDYNAERTMQEHINQIKRLGIGTHFGSKSELAQIMKKNKWNPKDENDVKKGVLYFYLRKINGYDEKKTMDEIKKYKFNDMDEILLYAKEREDKNPDASYKAMQKNIKDSSRLLEEEKIPVPKMTSCITFCTDVLKLSLDIAKTDANTAGLRSTFEKGDGILVAKQLQDLGYNVVYVVPDSKNMVWNYQVYRPNSLDPIQNDKRSRLNQVTETGTLSFPKISIPMDEVIANYMPSTYTVEKQYNKDKTLKTGEFGAKDGYYKVIDNKVYDLSDNPVNIPPPKLEKVNRKEGMLIEEWVDQRTGKRVAVSSIELPVKNPTPLNTQVQWKDSSGNKRETETLEFLRNNPKVNGGMLIAEGGVHTAIFARDPKDNELYVIEQHWEENLNSQKVFEKKKLKEWSRTWSEYVLVLPPGTIPKKKY